MRSRILFLLCCISVAVGQPEIFFSEYGEGSANNKYLEIYNGSGETINLDDYVLLGNSNGNPWSQTLTFVAGATLESGDVYVLAQADASEAIVDLADETWAYGDETHPSGELVYIMNFNGDDVRALASAIDPENNIIDIIGTLDGGDPGSGWDVAGVVEATRDHTLVRKNAVLEGNGGDWATSAGTNANNSEWLVADRPTNDYTPPTLGWHLNTTYSTWHVSTSGSDEDGDGSQGNPFATIQHGIAASGTGDTVLVYPGTYEENLIIYGKNLTLASNFIFSEDSLDIGATVISGSEQGYVILSEYSSLSIVGLTIEGGFSEFQTNDGIRAESSGKFSLINSVLKNCQVYDGNGVAAKILAIDSVYIEHSLIQNNHDNFNTDGVIIAGDYEYLSIKNTDFINNSATTGSALRISSGLPSNLFVIDSCRFINNISGFGGSIWNDAFTGNITNSLFLGNSGLMSFTGSYFDPELFMYDYLIIIDGVSIINNDFAINYVNYNNPSLIAVPSLEVSNSVFWNNQSDIEMVDAEWNSIFNGSVNVFNSLIDTLESWNEFNIGSNNIFLNPLFCDPENSDYSLAENSPCVGTGENGSNIGAFGVGCGIQALNVPTDYATIQAGINAASNGDTVLVAAGTYYENINYNGKNIVVGSLYLTTQDTSYISSTIIDGNQAGSVVTFTSGEDTTAILNGFTIQNGSADYGGGIYIHDAGPTLKYLIIRNNVAGGEPQGGGGIGIEGIYEQTDKLTKIINCLFYDNQAGRGQAIKSQDYTGLQIIQSTFFNNTVVDSFSNFYEYTINGTNNIFWGNDNILQGSSNFSFSYSNIQGGYEGEGNIDSDPLFVDADNDNYHLSNFSPAIGTGTAAGAPKTDLDGNPRPNPEGSNPDMGAYENALGSPANAQPTITSISNVSILEEASEQTVNMAGIGDGDASLDQTLTITATSSNTNLIPNPAVNYTSGDATGQLTFTPVADAYGTAVVTVRVEDDGGTENGGIDTVIISFDVAVTAVNDVPTIANITDPETILEDAGEQTINFSGIGTGAANENQTITITATSSDISIIPNPTVVYTSPNAEGTLSYTPVANANGTATITVTVQDDGVTDNDGINTATVTFTVTVTAINDPPVMAGVANQYVDEDDYIVVDLVADDVDAGDDLEYFAYADTSAVMTSIDGQSLTLDPIQDWNGTATITAGVSDGEYSDSTTFSLTVNDMTPPVVGTVVDGLEGELEFTASTSTLSASWSGFSDSGSGIQFYEYAVGTTSGGTDMTDWTVIDLDSTVTDSSLVLAGGQIYHISVRATDLAQNTSDIVSSDGITVDIQAPQNVFVYDGLDSDDQDVSISMNTLSARWYFTDALSGVASYRYAIGTTAEGTQLVDWTETDADSFFTHSDLELLSGITYYVSVTATDALGNESSSSVTDGISVDFTPPEIINMSIDPLSFVSSTNDTEIEIEFSEPLQSHHVELVATIQSGYAVTSLYSEDPPKLSLTLQAPFASLDTLTLIVNNVVDLAGVQAEEQSFTYYSNILADYNSDQIVDIIDLVQFIQGWTNNDITLELGPVTGTVPHLIPDLDNLFTVRDAMTFSRMWYWSNTSATNTIAVRSGVGAPIEINQSGSQITITLPDGSIASEIAIEYPLENMEFSYQSTSSQENEIVASKKFGEEMVFMQLNGFVTSEGALVEKEIMFDINGSPDHEIELVIHYRFIGSGSEIIGSGSYRLNYLPMPDEFSLYQNYPNPFNPVTQIKYDLPEASHVQLFIYDILGREVTALVNEVQEPGYRSITWHGTDAFGRNVGAGMYFYSLQAGDFRQVKKMVLLK